MSNITVKNSIEGSRSVETKIGTKTFKDKFSKLNVISNDGVVKILADTDKKFMKGDVVKIENNVAKFFTGAETTLDSIVPGIVTIGNWQTDGYEYVYVLIGGVGYIYTTEEINAGEKLFPADDNTIPVPVRRYVKKAGEEDIPYWVALEHSDADTFIKVKFLTQGGGGGGDITVGAGVPCKITAGAGPAYVVDVYGNGPFEAATATGKVLFIMQMVTLQSLAAGTWVVGCAANIPVLGEEPA